HDVNTLGCITRGRVPGDGQVGDEVVIAQGEEKNPGISIFSDLVVGDGDVGDLGVGPGAGQVGPDVDAEAALTQAVSQHQVLGDGGVGKKRARGVAGPHNDAVKLGFCKGVVRHRGVRDGPQVRKITGPQTYPEGEMLHPEAVDRVVTGNDG